MSIGLTAGVLDWLWTFFWSLAEENEDEDI